MDELMLRKLVAIEEALLAQARIMDKLSERVEKSLRDWEEFAERFDETMTSLENERRLDRLSD